MKDKIRDLSNTPFSLDRLFVWAVGFALVLSTSGIIALALTNKPESRVLNNMATFSLGSFVTMITRKKEGK